MRVNYGKGKSCAYHCKICGDGGARAHCNKCHGRIHSRCSRVLKGQRLCDHCTPPRRDTLHGVNG
jgi:hypothetical protein